MDSVGREVGGEVAGEVKGAEPNEANDPQAQPKVAPLPSLVMCTASGQPASSSLTSSALEPM
jgi:hypothetical protein